MTDLFANLTTKGINNLTKEPETSHFSDTKPLTKDDSVRGYVTLTKGKRVTMKSGRVLTVDGWSINFFWAVKDSLPFARKDVVS